MSQFWVVGGEGRDGHVIEAAAPAESWSGPYKTYETARREWARCASAPEGGRHYRIERIDLDDPPPCTD